MISLDPMDAKILARLQQRCDEPLEELGQHVGLSRNAVWRRVKALEDRGVLTGRVAVVDPAAVGLGLMVFIQVRAAHHSADWLDQFRRAVRAMPEILGVYRMTGDLDYLIRARVADMADYDKLYQRLIARIEMGDVSASFVMEELKEGSALPL
ncbi:Lrp/AsnC family transcriptional regulator [Gymnodinialimonas sp. 57CJ19]|uniref:Lrp/AsnC family transcriptional regulator n=1 Tax=Gymnodinialimonas sp. 57CJ19 TaxID=3138498 RepID=UPI00313458D1